MRWSRIWELKNPRTRRTDDEPIDYEMLLRSMRQRARSIMPARTTEARTDNAVAVKFIRAPSGQRFPYVSAQAVRFWLRTQVEPVQAGWTAVAGFRETKVAYTDAEPTKYAEDNIFGYMRAASKSTDEKKAAKRAEIAAASTPVDAETGEVTRISPSSRGHDGFHSVRSSHRRLWDNGPCRRGSRPP